MYPLKLKLPAFPPNLDSHLNAAATADATVDVDADATTVLLKFLQQYALLSDFLPS